MKHRRILSSIMAVMVGFSGLGLAEACELQAGAGLLPQGTGYLQNAQGSLVLYRAEVRRDDDGAPNAYSPCGANWNDAPCHGVYGLDHICSGATIRDGKGNKVPPSEPNVGKPGSNSRRCLTAYREAMAAQFPECGKGLPCVAKWPGMMLEARPHAAPGLASEVPMIYQNGPYKGYYVPQTTLQRANQAEPGGVSSLDARKVPYVVVPGNSLLVRKPWSFGSSRRADLALVFYRQRDGSTRGVFAVVGDTGPTDQLGEGSPALLMRLRGVTGAELDAERPNKTLAAEIGPGAGAPTYVLFRNSSSYLDSVWPKRDLTAADIATAGQKALQAAGGLPALAGCRGVPSNVATITLATQ